ncbi:MAG: hypothetical protein V4461_11820 [Pseudomonadota bacterium]
MGNGKRKRARFLEAHPWCCFCGGDEQATTIDHIPARACFKNRAYPEGFEFPACSSCQAASRKDDMAFAFYVRLLDRNPENFDDAEIDRMMAGLRNNLPHLFPDGHLTNREKRKVLRQMGLEKPQGLALSQVPAVKFDSIVHSHIDRYTRKIALALYYREQGVSARRDHMMLASWGQSASPTFVASMAGFVNMTPIVTVGARSNLNFGDQFSYRCNKRLQPDVFAMIAQFGAGIIINCLIVEPDFHAKLDEKSDVDGTRPIGVWVSVKNNYPPLVG